MHYKQNSSGCQDIGQNLLLNTQIEDPVAPRRGLVRKFENRIFLILWIALSIPIVYIIYLLITNINYDRDYGRFLVLPIWLIFALAYTVFQNKYGTESLQNISWYLRLFHKKFFLYHAIINLMVIAYVDYVCRMEIPEFREWIWLLYFLPPVLASEYSGTKIFLGILLLSVFSMTVVDLLINRNFLFNSTENRWLSIISPLLIKVWILVILASIKHYLKRKYIVWTKRSYLLQECISRISQTNENVLQSLEGWITSEIGKRLKFQHVFILLLSDTGTELEVAGGFSLDTNTKNREIRFSKDKGICGHVLRTKSTHLAKDIGRCIHYLSVTELNKTKSELAAPIIVNNKVIGVLDIQSERLDDFSYEDIHISSVLANAIGLKFEDKYRSLTDKDNIDALETLNKVSAAIHKSVNINGLFKDFAEKLVNNMGVSIITMYRLAPGTGFPLLPPLVYGDVINKKYLEREKISRDSILFDLLNDWQPRYSKNSALDEKFGYSNRNRPLQKGEGVERFTFRENISSTAFIPIGTFEQKIAALFVNYRYPQSFEIDYRIKIQALANLYAIQMLAVQQKELRNSPLLLDVPDFHMKFGLRFLELSKKLDSALAVKTGQDEIIKEVKNNLKTTTKDVFLEDDPEIRVYNDIYELERRLIYASKIILQAADENIDFQINLDPNIFYSGQAVLQAVYSITSEAMLNSVFHGKATKVEVTALKNPENIYLLIRDNGCGFDVAKAQKIYEKHKMQTWQGIRGIFSRLEDLRKIFGSLTTHISADKNGTEVIAEIPLITEL